MPRGECVVVPANFELGVRRPLWGHWGRLFLFSVRVTLVGARTALSLLCGNNRSAGR